MTPASCRLHVLLAAGSPKAVVIRRGPSRMACLVAWDRSNDTFEVGQWFRGRIYEDRCDLSEDGTLMVVFLASQRPPLFSWTVLCRPPFLTALSLWPDMYSCAFVGPRTIGAGGFPDRRPSVGIPPSDVRLVPYDHNGVEAWRASRPGAWKGGIRTSPGKAVLRRGPDGYSVSAGGGEHPLEGVAWADFDANGDLLFALGGEILRLAARRFPRDLTVDAILERARSLVDLSDLRFRPLAAPYDTPRKVALAPAEWETRIDRTTREDRRERAKARRSNPG